MHQGPVLEVCGFAQRGPRSEQSTQLGKALLELAAALALSGCARAGGDGNRGTAAGGGGFSSVDWDTWNACRGKATYDLCVPATRVAAGEPLYDLTPVGPGAVGEGGAPAHSSQGGASGYGGMAANNGAQVACVPTDRVHPLETTGFHVQCGYELSTAPVVQRDDLC